MQKPRVWANVHGLYVPGGEDPDRIYFPRMDEIAPGEPIVRFRSLDDPEFRRQVRREQLRSEKAEVVAFRKDGRPILALAGGAASPPEDYFWGTFLQNSVPGFYGAAAETPVAVSPTTLGATTARVFPFSMERSDWVIKIYLSTPSALASAGQIGIFSSTGANRIYNSGAFTTTANITVITPTAFVLAGGSFYYFAITNNNTSSATTSYLFSPAFVAATPARFGTVAATSGAMPATITPSGITPTVGGWPFRTWLAAA